MKGSLSKIVHILEQKTEDHLKDKTYLSSPIELEDVHFSYKDYSIINGVTLKIKPGQQLAIVGPYNS
ncbi:hypothetical protein ACQV2R_01130 [Facklamia sp. P12937]|uniref:hypothetical protein n=1 Tax=Facklamia sp. P12937 TaxID=3421949 RepID=UPI003D17A67E